MLRKADRRVSQCIRLTAYQTTHYCIRFRVEYRLFSLSEALPPVITTLGQWREAQRPQLERVLAATVPTEPALYSLSYRLGGQTHPVGPVAGEQILLECCLSLRKRLAVTAVP